MNCIIEALKAFFKKNKKDLSVLGFALLESALIYYCLELGNKNPFFNGLFYTGINIFTVFAVMAAVYIIVQRWWISSLIVSVPVLFLSVANYYTLLYRNSPISTQDIHNAGTTLSVIGSYKFPISIYVVAIVVFFGLALIVARQLYLREKGRMRHIGRIVAERLCLIVLGFVFIYSVYFSPNPIKPRNTFVWSWEDSYHTYGYAASSIEVFQNSMNMVTRPENYSEERLKALAEEKDEGVSKGNTPDIIFILNETFYDMRDLIDLEGEQSAMPFIDSLPETQKGRTIVAGTGGGTNKSEYEFLTSNTIQLMPGITPFNYLEFDNANSIVSHLESIGYSTHGSHCAEALNYSRGIVYPKLGFDKVWFREDFGETGKYGQRPYATDEFCYGKILEEYETMGEGPRFMYLLTIQNHGGWELNPDEEDIIRISKEYGEYTDDISEFQSCISLSDKAFRELTEYFSDSERDVVICMVGDHAPSFATSLIGEIDMEETFALRSTPYVVWANFELEGTFPQTTSMPFLAPMVLKAAGCTTSVFYDYLNNVQKDVPVLTAFNIYKNVNGESFNYSDETPYKEMIDKYFDMVYNNASPDAERIQKIFEAHK